MDISALLRGFEIQKIRDKAEEKSNRIIRAKTHGLITQAEYNTQIESLLATTKESIQKLYQ